MKGIDVSQHNGAIDWPKVKKAGMEFAIVRAGYGRFRNQTDKLFAQNAQGRWTRGCTSGAYWFSYATTRTRRGRRQRCAARCSSRTAAGWNPGVLRL